jgi:phosphate-selective porin OprO/OprP
MERAAFTDAFDLDRRIGFGAGSNGEGWTVDVGIFSQNAGDNSSGVTEGYAAAARGTYAFTDVIGSQDLLHTGVSARFRDLNNDVDDQEARYRQRPFFHDTNRSVDTGNIDNAQNDVLAGLELAYVTGPLSFQGEAAHTWLNRNGGSDNLYGLWGGYIGTSYFLTGESRATSYKGGKFDRVKVNDPIFNGGWGAWELGARFDYIDLNSNDSRSGDNARGGEQYSGIFGINWYLNDHVRMMANYAYTYVFNARGMGGNQVVGSSNVINGFGLRGQVDF